MSRKRRNLILITICIVLLGVFLFYKAKNGGVKVTVSKTEVRNISKTISASGETQVPQQYTQKSFNTGIIKKINFESGNQVKMNNIVIEMDQVSLKASLDAAYSLYLEAKTGVDSYDQKVKAAESAEESAKRIRDAAWRVYMSNGSEDIKQAYKSADATYQSAYSSLITLRDSKSATQSAVNSTYAAYLSSLNNYKNATVKAPADGKLSLNNISEGGYVVSGQELFSIIGEDNMVFKAEVDEADISHVQIGMKTILSLDSFPGETFSGQVSNIDAKVQTLQNGSAVVIVDITFDQSKIKPILNLNGSVDIELEKTDGILAITPDAIFQDLGKDYVYIVNGGIVHRQEIVIGVEGNDYTGVVSGLSEGDVIILDLQDQVLKEGQAVQTQ